jgi:L-fuconate dehydratase
MSFAVPGGDASVGHRQVGQDENQLRENARRALDQGFRGLKLKVGSGDVVRDVRRARLLRDLAGPERPLMVDANQQWTVEQAETFCREARELNLYWIEEPTHPDDIEGHARLAKQIEPIRLALGEHVPNRVLFRNFMARSAVHFVQADCTRLAGVSEFIAVSLLARKYGLPVVPHVGDMVQIHQHLVLFNRIALGHPVLFLEHIPTFAVILCIPRKWTTEFTGHRRSLDSHAILGRFLSAALQKFSAYSLRMRGLPEGEARPTGHEMKFKRRALLI